MRGARILAVVLTLLVAAAPMEALADAPVLSGPILFASFSGLVGGITTDADGNVYVFSDAVNSLALSKLAPNGALLAQVHVGNFTSAELLGALTTDPTTGWIWLLSQNGSIYLINPNTLQFFFLFDAASNLDASQIYDIQTGLVNGMAGLIQPWRASYNDIALLSRPTGIDVFVTGLSVGFPFVGRLRFTPDVTRVTSARVVVATRATSAPNQNVARGVAVNRFGTVFTTLPAGLLGSPLLVDRAVAFSADFPEGQGSPPRLVLEGRDFTSAGATADVNGNFYVATGAIGTSFCGVGGSGAIVTLPPDVSDLECANFGDILVLSKDVTVGPRGDVAYAALQQFGRVARFNVEQRGAPPPPPPAACAPRPRVVVQTAALGGGRLQVTVSATGANNGLVRLHVDRTDNALVEIVGQPARGAPIDVSLPEAPVTTTFVVQRAAAGAATVRLTVEDRCGSWPTFVGGGPAAF